ncbi:hypothetical protein SAMN05216524_10479 [Mucilaginibacter sp. OK098]|nr:hypothetical protein SAMN05216524_10479 [Mucilaginibacter sp. OK098]
MNKNSRSANLIEIIEVVFKDGSSISFTNVLISDYEFSFKFSDKWKLSPIPIERTSILKML